MVEMLKNNLGVDVSIAQAETATFYDEIDQGKLQVWTGGWIMDYPDPEDIIDLLFYSKSRQNNTNYSSPQVDSLVEQARVEQDQTKRLQLYQQAEKIIIQDAPWIPMFYGRDHEVIKPYVKNFDPVPITIPHLRYVKIEK
jgi:ABC-type oligopeptide transport system substrate-binding subunit